MIHRHTPYNKPRGFTGSRVGRAALIERTESLLTWEECPQYPPVPDPKSRSWRNRHQQTIIGGTHITGEGQ